MKIFNSNDDGILGPDILVMARVAGKFGEGRIIAPDIEQSAMSPARMISGTLNNFRTVLINVSEIFSLQRNRRIDIPSKK
jgi:5'-nucleotidase